MKRNYLPRLVIDSVPASDPLGYVKRRAITFRERHPDFDNYLKEISAMIDSSDVNILNVLNNTFDRTYFIKGSDSIFNTFVKLYNYHFSAEETCDYIKSCKDSLNQILNSKFEVKGLYIEHDNIEFLFNVVDNDDEHYKDYWLLDIFFSSNKILPPKIKTDVESIEDALIFFDGQKKISDQCEEIIYSEYNDIMNHYKELKPILNGDKKLSLSNIQKLCNIGFGLANNIYRKLEDKNILQPLNL